LKEHPKHDISHDALVIDIAQGLNYLHEFKPPIVHGDLTTSNMMLRPRPDGHGPANGHNAADALLDGDVVLIDFGLASQSTHEEDRAVDLYVLERAFGSTHPKAEVLFSAVLDAYRETFKAAPAVLRRLEDVRLRGRKRSMIG